MAPTVGMQRYNSDLLRLERSFDEGGSFSELDLRGNTAFNSTTLSSTGTVNNIALPNARFNVLKMSNASLATLTGFAVTGGNRDGDIVVVLGTNAQVNSTPQDTNSSASNRLLNTVGTGPTVIAAAVLTYGYMKYVYAGNISRWVLVGHDQGNRIFYPHASAVFGANNGATWTVTSGNYQYFYYWQRLGHCTFSWSFQGTAISVASPSLLTVQLPNGWVWRDTFHYGGTHIYTGAAHDTGHIISGGSTNLFNFYKRDFSLWGIGANFEVNGQFEGILG